MPQHSETPIYETDLFSPTALREPFGHYRAMRDLGPVVRLRDPDVFALPRFDDVRDALQASDILYCSGGVGFSPEFNQPGMPNLLQSDGDQHRRLRAEVIRPLLPAQLKQHRALLKTLIAERISALVDRGPFDAVAEIARLLPLAAISALVGLPEEGRAAMLDWAAATFNALGPRRDGSDRDFELLAGWRTYLLGLEWTDIREGSWARTLEGAIASGKLSEAEARGALSAYVIPSLDTTILAKGHLLHNLARNPEQWRLLRNDPSLITSAVIEGVRHSSVVRWFSRLAKANYRVGGEVIPAGSRLMIMYACANRDERRFEDPDRFDVTRDARAQLAWGSGPHLCGGMHLAKMEMEVMLEALIEQCEILEAGTPEVHANRGLFGFTSLPFELRSRA
ncbi:cytochrome P450 [Lichenicoccus sp.]|uniref:cytochrome P450 n=1 Tax=Lichenicoccus sp. TaxID=2781899 RepID=UPI003D0FDB4E